MKFRLQFSEISCWQTDTHKKKKSHTETHRQTDRHTYRHTYRHTHTHKHTAWEKKRPPTLAKHW